MTDIQVMPPSYSLQSEVSTHNLETTSPHITATPPCAVPSTEWRKTHDHDRPLETFYHGTKFPYFTLSDADDKYFFDLEVHM